MKIHGPLVCSINFKCSGALISNEHILLSAYCTLEMIDFRESLSIIIDIRMGDNDVNRGNVVRRRIKRAYVHDNYSKFFHMSNREFDIAIIQLDEAVAFGDNIQPICLPQSPFVNYSNETLVIATGLYQ